MTERITGEDVRARRKGSIAPCAPGTPCPQCGENHWLTRLATQLDADARRLADLEAENAVLRSDAAEWRALQAVMAHPTKNPGSIVTWWGAEWVAYAGKPPQVEPVRAPTPSALLARLDALAEARKPKAEVWRWRFEDGSVTDCTGSPEELRHGFGFGSATWATKKGVPVREVMNAAGDILLLAEGRPVPEGFQ